MHSIVGKWVRMLGSLAGVALLRAAQPAGASSELTLVHINVGQGESTLMLGPADETGARVSVLMDAGVLPGDRVRAVLLAHGVKALDYVIASHYHADHIGGFGGTALLGRDGVPGGPGDDDGDGVANWLDAGRVRADPEEWGHGDDVAARAFIDRGDVAAPTSTALYQRYRGLANAAPRHVPLAAADDLEGLTIELGGGAQLAPVAANGLVRDADSAGAQGRSENERSLCFLLSYGAFHYLIGGDLSDDGSGARLEERVGAYIQDRGVRVDVLLVNHHGYNNASAKAYLERIRPRLAVISVGDGNPWGLPHAAVLRRLVAAGAHRIYQTNRGSTREAVPDSVQEHITIVNGDVTIATDGEAIHVSTGERFSARE